MASHSDLPRYTLGFFLLCTSQRMTSLKRGGDQEWQVSNEGLQPSFQFISYLDVIPQVLPDHTLLLHTYARVGCILSGKNKQTKKERKAFFFLLLFFFK